MGRPKGIHDVNISQRGQTGSQIRIVLLFPLQKADIFQKRHFARKHANVFRFVRQLHGQPQKLGKPGSHGLERNFFLILPFRGAPQMGEQHKPGTFFQRNAQCGQGGAYALVVADLSALHGHVEIFPDDHALSREVEILHSFDGHGVLLVFS